MLYLNIWTCYNIEKSEVRKMFKVGDKVKSRFGMKYEIVAKTDDNKYECKRLDDGKIIKLSEDKLIKLEEED